MCEKNCMNMYLFLCLSIWTVVPSFNVSWAISHLSVCGKALGDLKGFCEKYVQ